MFSLFKKTKLPPLSVDIHSHLIPGIDDGCKTIEQSIAILRKLELAGIRKVVTTPHIAQEFYPNSPAIIKKGLQELQEAMAAQNLTIQLEAAAEYYMDQHFLNQLKSNAEMLTYGDNYLLFETPFLSKPPFFDEVVFEIKARGFKPVFAHPERYQYIGENPGLLQQLKAQNILLQLNAGSLAGAYNPAIQKMAQFMIKSEIVDFLGSDIHHERHLHNFVKLRDSKAYQKLLALPLLNDQLLT